METVKKFQGVRNVPPGLLWLIKLGAAGGKRLHLGRVSNAYITPHRNICVLVYKELDSDTVYSSMRGHH